MIVAGYYGFILDIHVSVRPSLFSFPDEDLSKCQWIFIEIGTCLDIAEIWFGIADVKFR